MNRRMNRITTIAGLSLGVCLVTSTAFGGGVIQCELGLDADKFDWNRLRASGSVPAPAGLCNGTAPDSLNDGLPFCAFPVRATDLIAVAEVRSLEALPLDFDPLVLVYCGDFSPTNPTANLIAVDDDGAGYPDATLKIFPTALGDTFVVVVTSYSAFNGSEFGNFEVVLTGLEPVGPCACSIGSCLGDANGDGTVAFSDITEVLANWLNDYTPGTGPGDANGDGVVTFADITAVLAAWLQDCP